MHVSSLFSSSQLCRLESGCLITVKYSAILPISCVDQRVDGLCGVVLGVCSVQAPCMQMENERALQPLWDFDLGCSCLWLCFLEKDALSANYGQQGCTTCSIELCVCVWLSIPFLCCCFFFFEKKHSVLVSLPFSIIDTCMRHVQLDFIHGEGTVHVDMESFSLATKYYISRNIITYYARGSETSSAHKKIYCIIFHASPEYANASVRSSDIHYNNDQAVLCDINH